MLSLLAPLTLIACSGSSEPNPDNDGRPPITLVYSHNVDGEIEPCG